MIKRWLTLLLAVMLVFVYAGSAFALTVNSNTKDTSDAISFKDRIGKFSVKYHTNGGGGTAPIDANYYPKTSGQFIVLGQGEMTAPAGKNFSGWSTDPNAASAAYLPGKTVSGVKDNIDFYAVWTAATPVKVTYNYKDKDLKKYTKAVTYVNGQEFEMPSIASLGFPLSTNVIGWCTDIGCTSPTKAAGTTEKAASDTTYYAQESTSAGTAEFVVTVDWQDATDYQEMRPSLNELMSALALDPAAPSGAKVSALSVSANQWKFVWTGLNKGTTYKVVPSKVDGYECIHADNAVTYKRAVGEAVMTMWITNKKWDKYGELIKFKAGQTVRFRMDVTNVGNGTLHDVQLYECLKGARFKKADGYKVTSDGYAYIGDLGVGETVSVWATYRVTNSDTRKEKVANVAGVDFMREDKTWGSDGDAVRIPINRKSSTSSATAKPTATPIPTATPVPVQAYMVEKLVNDLATISLAYPTATIDVVGAQEILTPEEYAVYQKLTAQEKVLTVLNSIGFERLIPAERLRLNLQVSETALNLMNNIYVRKQGMTAEQKAAQQAKENLYFPKQSVTSNGFIQNYFEIALRITINGKVRTDRYTFREEPTTGQWSFVRAVSEQ